MELGTIGIWRTNRQGIETVPLLDELGFGTLWMGGSPGVEEMRAYLEATSAMTVATGILNVWQHDPADVAAQFAVVAGEHPGRFLLGIGIGHPEATSDVPQAAGDDARVPRRARRRAAARAARRADRRRARPEDARAGGDALARHAPVLRAGRAHADRQGRGRAGRGRRHRGRRRGRDRSRTARRLAREYAARYLATSNYTTNLERLGYTEAEFADGGSDRLIDAVVPHGSAEAIAEVVRAHLDAGADHVCLQPVGHGPDPEDDYRALAAALL